MDAYLQALADLETQMDGYVGHPVREDRGWYEQKDGFLEVLHFIDKLRRQHGRVRHLPGGTG